MKIKSFEVFGLLGRENSVNLVFNNDLNIITGRNGCGKTSALKLLWYILSGNILIALQEVSFKRAKLETSEYECTIYKLSVNTCRIEWRQGNEKIVFEDRQEIDQDGDVEILNAEDQANERLSAIGSSVFLPSFRRIEGGFTMNNRVSSVTRLRSGGIEESLFELSKRLSNGKHVFVASLSTVDIVSLLVKNYTDLSEAYNQVQTKTSQEIIEKIKAVKRLDGSSDNIQQTGAAIRVLDEIRLQIETMESSREIIMKPLEGVRESVMTLFRLSGIKLGKTISFGDAANAINSDALSAGEKQMLSFIVYNAFYKDAIFIIDEPELSLHVDWQRQLFPNLLAQQASNQFVIATHSPFIYSKYPDKELLMDSDRGDTLE
jgi:predicted ATP-binding protein involved in virulence